MDQLYKEIHFSPIISTADFYDPWIRQGIRNQQTLTGANAVKPVRSVRGPG